MAKGYKTEQESMECQTQNLFVLDKLLQRNGDDLRDVLDLMPGIFHLNKVSDLSIKHANSTLEKTYGLSSTEIEELGTTFINDFVHPDTIEHERPKILKFYKHADKHDSYAFFQKIRLTKKSDYFPIFTVTKALKGQDLLVTSASILSEIGELASKLERALGEQQFIRQNLRKFHSLTKREIQVLTLLALGQNNPKISDTLFISRRTVEQHRRHINKKLGIKSYTDLIKFAQAFDLI